MANARQLQPFLLRFNNLLERQRGCSFALRFTQRLLVRMLRLSVWLGCGLLGQEG